MLSAHVIDRALARGLWKGRGGRGALLSGGWGLVAVANMSTDGNCSFDVLVEHAGAPDHDDKKGQQDAEWNDYFHVIFPICILKR